MSRLGFVSAKCLHLVRLPIFKSVRRTFLSEAYRCQEAWEKRLESPLLKKVNVSTLYQELDWQFSHFERANAIDVDIYLNASTEKAFMEDVEDIIHKLRLSPDTTDTLPSTHHAVVRLLLGAKRTSTLLKVMTDRMGYGIFPDHFSLNILMDTFLKEQNYAAAARVAVSQMIQEDWENLLTTRLALYSCHMFLRNPEQTWYSDEEIVPPVPEPKEIVKVRVKYIRKPYFDDHFDLKDPMLLVGKTLSMFCSKIGGNEPLISSYKLLGLTLHQKWNQVLEFSSNLSQQGKPIHREAIELAKKSMEVKESTEKAPETSKPSKPVQPDPLKEEALKAELELKQKVTDALIKLETSALTDDLLGEMSTLVKEAVKQQEKKDIEEQQNLYPKWEELRVQKLREHQAEVEKEETLKRIEKQKLELVEKEREIFFFENEDKVDILIEDREANEIKPKEKVVSAKAEKALKEAEYIPPEVFKRYT